MDRGRNRALLVSARDANDSLVQCVVKLPGLMEMGDMHPFHTLLEWLAAAYARLLGITVPDSLEVIVTPAFATAIRDSGIRAGAMKSSISWATPRECPRIEAAIDHAATAQTHGLARPCRSGS